MITETFLKDLKKIVKGEKRWESKLNPQNAKVFQAKLGTSLGNDNR